MEQQEILSTAEMVAATLSGRGRIVEKAQIYQVTVKLPIYQVATLDAMASHSGKSRTEVLSMLLSVGIEEVQSRLDPATGDQVAFAEADALARLLGEV